MLKLVDEDIILKDRYGLFRKDNAEKTVTELIDISKIMKASRRSYTFEDHLGHQYAFHFPFVKEANGKQKEHAEDDEDSKNEKKAKGHGYKSGRSY